MPQCSLATWKRYLAAALAVAIATACAADIQPSSITVSAALGGTDGVGTAVPPVVLTVTRDGDPSNPRLVYLAAGGLQALRSVTITADQSTGLPAEEEFFVLSLSRIAFPPGSDTPPLNETTEVPGWMRQHLGDLVVLPLRKDDISLPSNDFDAFQPAQLRPAGAAWLARVEDDDPSIPWVIPAGSANCQPVAVAVSMVAPPAGDAVDCFDVQTLASMFLTSFGVAVTDAVAGVNIPASTVAATGHHLHVVPHLPSSVGDPGFGFVYSVDLTVSTIGLPVASATAHVPISMHLRYDGGFYVDPLTPMTNPSNPSRVTVTYGEGVLDPVAATQIHTAIVAALGGITLPPLNLGTVTLPDGTVVPITASTEEAFELLLNQVSGRPSTAPSNFAIIALPEQRATVGATITNTALSIPVITRVIAAPAPAGATNSVTANAAGMVTVVRVTGTPPATASTTFTIPRPTVANAFKLVFLQ